MPLLYGGSVEERSLHLHHKGVQDMRAIHLVYTARYVRVPCVRAPTLCAGKMESFRHAFHSVCACLVVACTAVCCCVLLCPTLAVSLFRMNTQMSRGCRDGLRTP